VSLPILFRQPNFGKHGPRVNKKLTAAFEGFTPQDWLQKHAAVSDEDFSKDPSRNRLAIVISRTNHASYHSGQAVLTK
jgi:hypothetical protein